MTLNTIHTHLGNKWIRINGISNDLKKVLSGFEGDNLIGYVYIDHEAGVTLEVIKLFDIEDGKINFNESPIDKNIRIISRLNGIVKSKEIHILSEELISEFDLKIPEYLASYERPDLKEFRRNEKFHEFRGEGFPDDVQVLLLPNNKIKPELIWGRVEKFYNDTLEFQLLNQPHSNFGISINDMLKASIQNFENDIYIVCEIEIKSETDTYNSNNKSWWKFW